MSNIKKKYSNNRHIISENNVVEQLWKIYPHSNDTNCDEYRSYYPDGQLYTVSFYRNGKKNGEYKRYNMNGEVLSIQTYIDGQLQKKN